MDPITDINQDPELANWLAGLKRDVQAKSDRQNRHEISNEPTIALPRIDMSRKFRQNEGKVYPEFQGTIALLPVSYKGQRVIEINQVYKVWCPIDDDWNRGFMYRLLPEEYYPEGEIRNRVREIRNRLRRGMEDTIILKDGSKLTSVNNGNTIQYKALSWKECKRQNFSLMLGLVLNHRNTQNTLVSSCLFGGDTFVEHKNVPALIICPNNMLQTAIQNDLDMKPDPVPFAIRVYSNTPLNERQGWLTIKFTDKTKGIGYDVTASTDIVNPIVMPDGLLPKDFNFNDERVKLLYTTDPVRHMLDRYQVGEGEGVYYNEDTLRRLEDATAYFIKCGKAKAMKQAGKTKDEIAYELDCEVAEVDRLTK